MGIDIGHGLLDRVGGSAVSDQGPDGDIGLGAGTADYGDTVHKSHHPVRRVAGDPDGVCFSSEPSDFLRLSSIPQEVVKAGDGAISGAFVLGLDGPTERGEQNHLRKDVL